MKIRYSGLWMIGLFFLYGLEASEVPRTWTDVQGRPLTATLLEPGYEQVKVQVPGGEVFEIPMERLSEGDQIYVRQRLEAQVAAGTLTGVRIPPSRRTWPESVGVSPTSVQVTFSGEKSDNNAFVYYSEDFEFIADDKLATWMETVTAPGL
jgi:hypothetical protein